MRGLSVSDIIVLHRQVAHKADRSHGIRDMSAINRWSSQRRYFVTFLFSHYCGRIY